MSHIYADSSDISSYLDDDEELHHMAEDVKKIKKFTKKAGQPRSKTSSVASSPSSSTHSDESESEGEEEEEEEEIASSSSETSCYTDDEEFIYEPPPKYPIKYLFQIGPSSEESENEDDLLSFDLPPPSTEKTPSPQDLEELQKAVNEGIIPPRKHNPNIPFIQKFCSWDELIGEKREKYIPRFSTLLCEEERKLLQSLQEFVCEGSKTVEEWFNFASLSLDCTSTLTCVEQFIRDRSHIFTILPDRTIKNQTYDYMISVQRLVYLVQRNTHPFFKCSLENLWICLCTKMYTGADVIKYTFPQIRCLRTFGIHLNKFHSDIFNVFELAGELYIECQPQVLRNCSLWVPRVLPSYSTTVERLREEGQGFLPIKIVDKSRKEFLVAQISSIVKRKFGFANVITELLEKSKRIFVPGAVLQHGENIEDYVLMECNTLHSKDNSFEAVRCNVIPTDGFDRKLFYHGCDGEDRLAEFEKTTIAFVDRCLTEEHQTVEELTVIYKEIKSKVFRQLDTLLEFAAGRPHLYGCDRKGEETTYWKRTQQERELYDSFLRFSALGRDVETEDLVEFVQATNIQVDESGDALEAIMPLFTIDPPSFKFHGFYNLKHRVFLIWKKEKDEETCENEEKVTKQKNQDKF